MALTDETIVFNAVEVISFYSDLQPLPTVTSGKIFSIDWRYLCRVEVKDFDVPASFNFTMFKCLWGAILQLEPSFNHSFVLTRVWSLR